MKNWGRDIQSRIDEVVPKDTRRVYTMPLLSLTAQFELEIPKVLKDGLASKRMRLADDWKNRFQREYDEMLKDLEELTETGEKSDLPPQALAFVREATKEAASLAQALAKLYPLGACATEIIRLTLAFEEKSDALEDIWKEVSNDMRYMDRDLDGIVKDVRETVDKAVEAIAKKHKSVYEYLLDIAEYIRKAPGPINPATLLGQLGELAQLAAALGDTPAAVRIANEKLWSRSVRLETELAKRGVGIVMFTESRNTTEEFLKIVNTDASAEVVKKSREIAKQAVSTCASPAQKSDVEAFGKILLDLIEDAHDRLCSAHDRFVSKHKGIFFAGVTSSTLKTLIHEDRFRRPLEDVRISRLNSSLRELYELDYINICLKGYSGDSKSALSDYLRREFDRLYKDIKREAKELKKFERELDTLVRKIRKLYDNAR